MNKPHGWTDYHERMGRVIAHVHDHLADPLDLQALADVAHLSAFHWHRVYHALQGETIAATVRRLRLQRASGYLANGTLPITTVAARCGYPNVQSFTRAFRAVYGASPRDYRAHGAHTAFGNGTPAAEATSYTVQVRDVAAVALAGLDHRGAYLQVGKAFETAYAHFAAQHLVRPGTRWLAVYFDDPDAVPERQLSARAGLSLPDGAQAAPPLRAFTLGGMPCAVLRHRGPYATMRAAYRWLYGRWLVQTGHAAADVPVFEEYLNSPRDTAPADLLTDIFLPLTDAGAVR